MSILSTIKSKFSSFRRPAQTKRQAIVGRAGLMFVAFALLLQWVSIAMPLQTQAATADDMVSGGATTKSQLLYHYDRNTNNFRDVMTYNGITRAEINSLREQRTRLTVKSGTYSWGWTKKANVAEKDQRAHSVGGRTIYSRPHSSWGYSWYMGWQGHSKVRGTFMIVGTCANLVTYTVPEKPKPVEQPKPAAQCDVLTVTPISRTKYQVQASASASNGATITDIHYYAFNDQHQPIVGPVVSGNNQSATMEINVVGNHYIKAFARTSLGNRESINCTKAITIKEEQKPAIDVVKTVNKKEHDVVAVGTKFTYEITVRNTGNVALKDAVVTDKAPAEVTLVSATEGQITGKEWKHTIPSLEVGQSKSYVITAQYDKYAAGIHKNTVCVDTPTVPGGPDDCDDATTETRENMEICDLTTNTIRTIDRSQFDSKTMTEDVTKCGDIKVCIIEEKVIKTIAKKDYNEQTMTTDYSRCEEKPVVPPAPTPEVPAEMPQTGMVDALSGVFGIGGLTGMSYAYISSRRRLS